MNDTYIIEQKIAPLVNQYRVFAGDAEGRKGDLLAFAQQKRFTMREKLEFFVDEQRTQLLFTVRAAKVLDVHGNFLVEDDRGAQLGTVRKAFGRSLLRSTWEIMDGAVPAVVVQERSIPLALLRRLWGFIPYIGDLPFFLKYHFDLRDPQTKHLVAEYEKTTLFRDHYRLTIHDHSLDHIGWQTICAQAVLLDALQGR